MDQQTEREVAESVAAGCVQLRSMAELDARLSELGYRRERDSRCSCRAKNLTTGNTFDCITWGVREADTGMSAFNADARRDDNFRALQEFRRWSFVVVNGAIVTV